MSVKANKQLALSQTGSLEAEQNMLSAQHRATVSRIKSEIWSDRVSFLQKVLELAEVDESE